MIYLNVTFLKQATIHLRHTRKTDRMMLDQLACKGEIVPKKISKYVGTMRAK